MYCLANMRYLKVDEEQYQTLDKQYILSQKEGSRFGHRASDRTRNSFIWKIIRRSWWKRGRLMKQF